MKKDYKGYYIDDAVNDWGYYEATPDNCDSAMIYAKSIDQLKTEIDELD